MRNLNSQARARRGNVRALVALIILTTACGGEPAEQVTTPQLPSSVPTSALAERAEWAVDSSQAPLDTPAPQPTESPPRPPPTSATAPAPTGAERYDTDPAVIPPTTSTTAPSPALSPQPPGGATNPLPRPRPDGRRGGGGAPDGGVSAKASADEGDDSGVSVSELPADTAILLARPATLPARCVLFAPGAEVTLVADGFAANSAVTLSIRGASAAGTALSPAAIPATTADVDGRIEGSWTVPQAPDAATDAVPRWYFVEAAGTTTSGGRLTAVLPQPIVAYPGTAPCAADDAAVTTIGRAVRIAVLGNDVAPSGGSLDAASVRLESVHNGTVVVDSTDGSLTYLPDAGFVGTDAFRYWVYDDWGIGVRAEVTVVVSAGCTITGTAGVAEIVGTEGDDVICVPDPDDPTAFHIVDAKGGDDVILGGDGIDWIDGGPGSDTIYARRGADRIDGGPGVDTIFGGRGFDTIHSTDLADAIHDDADDELDGYELVLVPAEVSAPSAPVVAGDVAYVAPSEVLLIDVLGNDFDPDGDLDAGLLMITQAPAVGAAEILTTPDLGAHVSYTAPSAAGADTFAYQVCDRRSAPVRPRS